MWRVEMLRQEHRPTHHQPSPSSSASLLPRPWSSARVLLCWPTLWEGCPLTRPTPIPAPITIFTSVWVSTHHLTHQQGPSFGSCTGRHTSRFKVPIISLFALPFSLSELSNPGCSDSPNLSPYPHLITGLQCIPLLPPAPSFPHKLPSVKMDLSRWCEPSVSSGRASLWLSHAPVSCVQKWILGCDWWQCLLSHRMAFST